MVTATRAPARRGLTAERLARILDLERAGGCHDRAVIGGLDAFLERHAEQSADVQELARRLAPARYRELSPAARSTWLNAEIARLSGAAPAAPASTPAPAQPAATAKPAPVRAGAKAPPAPPAETALKDARLGIRHNQLACYEALGIATADDLLSHYPFRYHDFSATRSVRELQIGEEGAVSGVMVSVSAERWRGRMHGACKAQVRDAFGNMLAVTWFNQPWLATRLPTGSGIALVGKVGFNDRRGEVTMANPEFYLFDAREEYRGRLVPVYRSTRGLSQTMLRRHIEQALERYAEAIDEPLPGELRARHQLIGRRRAFREIHNPPHYAVARRAERRLAFDELLAVQLAVVRRKRRLAQADHAPAIAEPDTVRGFLESLPFALTAAQRRSLTEIEGELASTTPMARLLQGDVGSGKTVVALAAMLACANSGSQAALMAPTEVLAEQHFRTISSLLDTGRDMLSFGLTDLPYMQRRHVRAVLLTGSAGARKRREALAAIRNGSAGLVVGTHALIQDEVEFQRLGLAVVDEQHRFGVEQRSALRGGPDGATAPHLLVMTATPIPRSLALTAYGDLDLSLIDELPPGRAGIATKLLTGRARDEAFARARVEIAAGRQVFVICPLVEGSERVASRAATEEAERLRNEQFPDLADRIDTLPKRIALARRDGLDYADFLQIVLADEVSRRDHGRLELRLRQAGFEQLCRLEDFDWSAQVRLDRRLLDAACSLRFLDRREHVLLVGPAGVGKSFLAQALCYAAVRSGHSVRFVTADQYFRELAQARVDHSTEKAFRSFLAPDLLILDDLGLHRLSAQQSIDLYELVIGRHRSSSFVITSNRAVEEWLGLFDDPILGNSALDRLANASYQIVIEGESYRQRLSPHRALLDAQEGAD